MGPFASSAWDLVRTFRARGPRPGRLGRIDFLLPNCAIYIYFREREKNWARGQKKSKGAPLEFLKFRWGPARGAFCEQHLGFGAHFSRPGAPICPTEQNRFFAAQLRDYPPFSRTPRDVLAPDMFSKGTVVGLASQSTNHGSFV